MIRLGVCGGAIQTAGAVDFRIDKKTTFEYAVAARRGRIDPLVQVAVQIEDALDGRALRKRADNSDGVGQIVAARTVHVFVREDGTSGAETVVDGVCRTAFVAGFRFVGVAVGIGVFRRALARKQPFRFGTQSFAGSLASVLGLRRADVRLRFLAGSHNGTHDLAIDGFVERPRLLATCGHKTHSGAFVPVDAEAARVFWNPRHVLGTPQRTQIERSVDHVHRRQQIRLAPHVLDGIVWDDATQQANRKAQEKPHAANANTTSSPDVGPAKTPSANRAPLAEKHLGVGQKHGQWQRSKQRQTCAALFRRMWRRRAFG